MSKIASSLLLSLIFQFAFSWHSYFPTSSSSLSRALSSIKMANNDEQKPEKKKSTMFERSLDDFIGKRYGAGEAFYGKRTSGLTEDEYEKTQKPKRVYDKDAPMKDNSILIVGGINEIGQWLAYELNDKGFNVRVACSSLKEATDIFGFPGFNSDVIELKGDESDEKTYAQAINGVQAVILCTNFNPQPEWGSVGSKSDIEVATAKNIVNIAQKARQANVGEVKKIVHVSRVVPDQFKCSTDPITAWTDKVADNDMYTKFRSRHEQVEAYVRSSQFDYTIVRAPPVVLEARPPAVAPLTLLSSQETEAVVTPKDNGNFLTSLFDEKVPGAKIGILDLAEVAIQCLLQEVNGMTFSVFETDTVDATALQRRSEIISGQRELETSRISREAYYAVLTMTDEELRASWMIRSVEEYRAQLQEDERVEKYWLARLQLLEKD